MSWNYRLIKFVDKEGKETHRSVHEVYYNDKMELRSYAIRPVDMISIELEKSVEDLRWHLFKINEALDKELLLESDFNINYAP